MSKKKRAAYQRLTAYAAVLLAAVIAVLFLFEEKRDFSEMENRSLADAPEFSISAFTTGRFEQDFDDYLTDQFPLRDAWVKFNGLMNRIAGKRCVNGIYLCRDGSLIRDFIAPDDAQIEKMFAAITDFSRRHAALNQTMMIIPSAVSTCRDKLPAFASPGDEDSFINRFADLCGNLPLRFEDVRPALQSFDGQIYYRTDHHWTTDAAYCVYQMIAQRENRPGASVPYERALVSDGFRGTLTAMSGMRTGETDELCVYLPKNDAPNTVVTYVSEGKQSAAFYETEKLATRDQYAVFFGGNHPLVEIRTDSIARGTLLVLKDSYANCYLPFLAPDYAKIVVVDPRYYTDDLESLIASEGVTDVLFLYNAATLAGDTSLAADLMTP